MELRLLPLLNEQELEVIYLISSSMLRPYKEGAKESDSEETDGCDPVNPSHIQPRTIVTCLLDALFNHLSIMLISFKNRLVFPLVNLPANDDSLKSRVEDGTVTSLLDAVSL